MKKQFTISVFTENKAGLLTRVTMIFTRRKVNINSITASESEVPGIHRYTILVFEEEELVHKIVKQIEKQVDVHRAFYHSDEETVFQEIALYKVKTEKLDQHALLQNLVRLHNVRVLEMNKDYTVLEKTGLKEETLDLLEVMKPIGVLEFVRSGRVAISRPMKELKEYLMELEINSKQ